MTGNDFLKQLPADVREKFINNLEKIKGQLGAYNYLEKNFAHMHGFIDNGFSWRSTPEGHNYWRTIANKSFDDYKTKPYNDGTE